MPTLLYEPVVVPTAQDIRASLATLWGSPDGVLLGHAFDGVVWGKLASGLIRSSRDAGGSGAGPLLRWGTLIDLRLFAPHGELRMWREENGLKAVRVTERVDDAGHTHTRVYRIAGSPREATAEFATFISAAGHRQCPPISASGTPTGLRVRHYYAMDMETGLLRLTDHRLLELVNGDLEVLS